MSNEYITILEEQVEELKRKLEKKEDEDDTKMLEEHKKGLEKQNDRIFGFQTTAFQLTNWYFASQAVLFSPLAGTLSTMSCRDVWLPLVLSLVPAIFILCALGFIGNQYIEAIKCRDQSSTAYERLVRKMLHKNAENNNERPIANEPPIAYEPPIASDFQRKSLEVIFFYVCMFVFSIVAIVIAFGSYWRICLKS
ncbi:hypothetical protein Vadar_023337 [Vaccinium darrowii]|uniref:Uncharacterized protein n=1 Tax=Vaccinium darrowii TaxID=229202 RepID=A0ACB7XJG5_9ERIC|nr:hypothetical protein Vadar_023337 [Vaccinium darrowii]